MLTSNQKTRQPYDAPLKPLLLQPRKLTNCTNLARTSPIEYHRYGKVFSEEASQRLPEPRPWDHAIDLVEDAPEYSIARTYPLAEGQQELLDQFLEEHLRKDTYESLTRRMPRPSSSSKRMMANNDQYKTTDVSIRSPSEILIHFLSSRN